MYVPRRTHPLSRPLTCLSQQRLLPAGGLSVSLLAASTFEHGVLRARDRRGSEEAALLGLPAHERRWRLGQEQLGRARVRGREVGVADGEACACLGLGGDVFGDVVRVEHLRADASAAKENRHS